MAFTGNEPHDITLEKARALVANHRRTAAPGDHRCGFFGRAVIERILAQPGCVGIRIYFGRHDDGKQALVLVGVAANERDLADGVIGDDHKPCPPNCDAMSPLTS